MAISSPGVGSGLDIRSLIDQLVEIERQPLNRLRVREVELNTQISAYGALQSALGSFESALENVSDLEDFRILSAVSDDTDVLAATANTAAAKGVFNIEVDRLAENHRLAAGIVFADTDVTTIGDAGDTLIIDVGGEDFTVDYGGMTLSEVRNAINSAAGNTGVTASILNDDTGNRLIISGDDSGSSNFITVSYSGADPVNPPDPFSFGDLNTDRDGDLAFTAADLDASLTIEGQFTVTRDTNVVDDVIEGVTLSLLDTGSSTVTIDNNRQAVQDNIQSVVDSFNSVLRTTRDLRGGALSNDVNTLSRVELLLRGVLNSTINPNSRSPDSNITSIYDVGFNSQFQIGSDSPTNGQLTLDSAALQSALNDEPDAVADLFINADSGIVTNLLTAVGDMLGVDGLLQGKTDSLRQRIDGLNSQRESTERRISIVEQRLTEEFTALDTLLAQLQQTSSFLTQQLATLPTPGRN